MVSPRWARRPHAVELLQDPERDGRGPQGAPRGPCAGRRGSGVGAVAGRASSLGMMSLGLGFRSPLLVGNVLPSSTFVFLSRCYFVTPLKRLVYFVASFLR